MAIEQKIAGVKYPLVGEHHHQITICVAPVRMQQHIRTGQFPGEIAVVVPSSRTENLSP